MEKRKSKGSLGLTLLCLAVAAFLILGCDTPANDDGDKSHSGPASEWGEGWPSNSKLSSFGLDGMTAPSGLSDVSWASGMDYSASYFTIWFNGGNQATDESINGWLTSHGWSGSGYAEDKYQYKGEYYKNYLQAYYSRYDGEGSLSVAKY